MESVPLEYGVAAHESDIAMNRQPVHEDMGVTRRMT
jgi:hypothetical protein